MKTWVASSYLICRILDTIEDSDWATRPGLQNKAFKHFDQFIFVRPDKDQVQKWSQLFPKNIPAGERQLIVDASRIFNEFHGF
ncbi:MAG: hypothetical protein R2827_03040 [Bdellovibrionales bacterium]